MKVTTSRDPSASARRLGKTLARFLMLPYINRGKQALNDEEPWLVVVEDHGNPTGLVKRSSEGEEHLAFRLMPSSDNRQKQLRRVRPVVIGKEKDAEWVAKFFELYRLDAALTSHERIILVASESIDFVDDGEIVLRFKI